MGTRAATLTSMRHLYAMAEISRLKHEADVEVRVVAVPETGRRPKPGVFVKETMNELADLGERMGADPASCAWSRLRPDNRRAGLQRTGKLDERICDSRTVLAVLAGLAACGCQRHAPSGGADQPPHWSYEGATGPAHWGSLAPRCCLASGSASRRSRFKTQQPGIWRTSRSITSRFLSRS